MTVKLNGRVYTTVRDASGEVVVIVQQSRLIWRPVTGDLARDVINGFLLAPLTMEWRA